MDGFAGTLKSFTAGFSTAITGLVALTGRGAGLGLCVCSGRGSGWAWAISAGGLGVFCGIGGFSCTTIGSGVVPAGEVLMRCGAKAVNNIACMSNDTLIAINVLRLIRI